MNKNTPDTVNNLITEQTLNASAGITLTLSLTGIIWLVSMMLPTLPNRWIFFSLVFLFTSSASILFSSALSALFSIDVNIQKRLRRSLWFGFITSIITWLRIARLLTIPLVVVTCVIIVLIEYLIGLREKASQ